MKTFAELDTLDMWWVRAGGGLFKPERYELRDANEQVLASISRTGGKAAVEATGNRWKFTRHWGFFKPGSITIESIGTGEQPATYEIGMTGGTLTYADGRVFHWKTLSWFSENKWVWTDDQDNVVLGIHVKGVLQTKGEVHIDPEIDMDKAPPLLLFLGWYLIVLRQEEAAVIIG